jgi:uncharacterized caspase-like protein
MKKPAILVAFLLLVSAIWAQNKYALVIGNGNYTGNFNKLDNPVNDAADMEAALKELGFQVDLIKDANRSQMLMAVSNYSRKLKSAKNTYGFFYYAGHGTQDKNGNNYLIPVNADMQNLNKLPDETLSVNFILDEIEDAGNELNVVVLDACRNLPRTLSRNKSSGLAPISKAPKGSIIMYSAPLVKPLMTAEMAETACLPAICLIT